MRKWLWGTWSPASKVSTTDHRYLDEKRLAFGALAQQVDRILNPQNNVVRMRGADETVPVAAAN
jgi:hypothetical protein